MSNQRMVVWMADVYWRNSKGEWEFSNTICGAVSDSAEKLVDACKRICKENGYSEPVWTDRGFEYTTHCGMKYCCWAEEVPVVR